MSDRGALGGPILAIDTSTKASIVAVGGGGLEAISRRDVSHRHGSHVLEQVDEVLASAGLRIRELSGVVVGTGPGSFTGLRVGMATAKTIAYVGSLPIVGVMSSTALRRAASEAGAPPDVSVVLPAGARDHYLVRADEDPILIPPGQLVSALHGRAVISVDMPPETLGAEADRLGIAALEGLPGALLELGRERLDAGTTDDVAVLVPAYVALPRGVAREADELGWSPDLR